MASCIENANIETATINCCDCGEVIFLKNPDNDVRIKKSSVISYRPFDVVGPPAEYNIEFMLDNGMVQIWTFTTMTARDDALAAVDNEMTAKTIP